MKNNIALAIDFTKKIKKIKDILQIVLFGSVARGEDTPRSDIDIAIIHQSKDVSALREEVNKNKSEEIHVTFVHSKELPNETEIVGALSGEGLLLYGAPIVLQEEKVGLQGKIILSYSFTGLEQTDKVKVNRALYGSVSRSFVNGKEYKTETKGLLNEPGIEKVNKGVLLVDRKKAANVKRMLQRFKVTYKEIPVWTY